MKVLSLDPSLRAFGWAIIEKKSIIACGCIITENDKSKLETDSDTSNLEYIASELKTVIKTYKPKEIVFENPIGSRSSRGNQALSFVKGLVVSAAIFSGIKLVSISAKATKKKITGDQHATKDLIKSDVIKNFPEFEILTKGWSKVRTYAASDAVAVFIGYKTK